jgi:hypothetical protein
MSSLPFISHHLFVAAVERERRQLPKPPQNQNVRESEASEIGCVEMPTGEFNLDSAEAKIGCSSLVRET